MTNEVPNQLPIFQLPYDWQTIDEVVSKKAGGAIIQSLLSTEQLNALNEQIDLYLEECPEVGLPKSGSSRYDRFLGLRTIRFHGLAEKFSLSRSLISDPRVIAWAQRMMAPKATSIQLNAGELIQIGPDEPAQFPHRDTDSWPLPLGGAPIIVNAIVALDDFTLENGATYIVPESWQWPETRKAEPEDYVRAVMNAGDAVFFRGDLIHHGGENKSSLPRRGISLSYCLGWLRPVENSFLNVSRETAKTLAAPLQDLLGYAAHDGAALKSGMVGLFENGDPRRALAKAE
ncbi:MAG: phytanoyl-CoA dioxygenase family protein [Pseudomonadota bacterium]